MRETYKLALKHRLRFEFIETRARLKLTQEEMAERLQMSTASYNELENGVYLCSTTTLVLFLTRCCADTVQFINTLHDIIDEAESAAM